MSNENSDNFEKRWQKIFQGFARNHEHDAGIAGWSETGLQARLTFFDFYFSQKKPKSGLWLDAGCGAGNYTRYLMSYGYKALGLDYSLPSLIKARLKSETEMIWLAGNVQSMPFMSDAFDGVLCFGVSQALSGSNRLLLELTRVARPRAEIWLDGLNRWCLFHLFSNVLRRIKRKPRHLHYEAPYGMEKKLRKLGCEDVALLWLPVLPAKWHRAQQTLEKPWCRMLWQKIPLLGLFASHAFVLKAIKKS